MGFSLLAGEVSGVVCRMESGALEEAHFYLDSFALRFASIRLVTARGPRGYVENYEKYYGG